jgi:hypothetical protein
LLTFFVEQNAWRLAVLSINTTSADEARICRRIQFTGYPRKMTIAGQMVTGLVHSVMADGPMEWTIIIIPKTVLTAARKGSVFALA